VFITKFNIKTKKIRSVWIWILLAWSGNAEKQHYYEENV
jgi:hypothetical protein